MHLLPRMNVMLDFIWTLPVQLQGTPHKWTLQKILIHGRIRTTITTPFAFQRVPLTTRLSGQLTTCDLDFYSTYLRSDTTRTLCGVQRDVKKIKINNNCLLTVSWLIPFKYEMINTKEEIDNVLYINDYIYNIYAFLFSIVYIVCIIICFHILYVFIA